MQQPNPFEPDGLDPDLDDELGTPVYEGAGLSVRALSAEELDRFLDAHAKEPTWRLGAGWQAVEPALPASPAAGPVAPGWPGFAAGGGARGPRGGYGSPGRSAQARYRRERARERTVWARSLPWRAALVLATTAGGVILATAAGLHGATLLVGLAAGGAVGWRLRFRPSRDTRAWRDGARGERATARLLRRLARRGYTVFHDVAIPGTPANADHVVIGPGGVVLVDSKRYAGRVWQGPDGRVWHNQYPMDRPLRALRMETAVIAELLGGSVRPVVCVHGARVDFAGLWAGGVEIVPAGRLHTVLTTGGDRLSPTDVAALAAHAHTMLRPRLMSRLRRHAASGAAVVGESARSRARLLDGRWVVLHGTLLGGGPGTRTAVIVEPARPAELAELIVLAYGLTPGSAR
jgi:Nuclease-related domain